MSKSYRLSDILNQAKKDVEEKTVKNINEDTSPAAYPSENPSENQQVPQSITAQTITPELPKLTIDFTKVLNEHENIEPATTTKPIQNITPDESKILSGFIKLQHSNILCVVELTNFKNKSLLDILIYFKDRLGLPTLSKSNGEKVVNVFGANYQRIDISKAPSESSFLIFVNHEEKG